MHQGSCLCKAIRFTVSVPLTAPDACHCTQCRKQSGHYFASVDVPRTALTIADETALVWYASSDKVRRGFCRVCGSSLFWDPIFRDGIGVAMGAFDTPTETRLALHIFTSQQGDYYQIADGLPQSLR